MRRTGSSSCSVGAPSPGRRPVRTLRHWPAASGVSRRADPSTSGRGPGGTARGHTAGGKDRVNFLYSECWISTWGG